MVSFDKFVKDYRSIHNENLAVTGFDSDYFAEHKVKIITQEKDINDYYKILDVGCGDGKLEECISRYFNNYEAYGIDISGESIEVALQKNIMDCEFFLYDGSNIPFRDNTFDIVILAGVLHHVPRDMHEVLLMEIFRVCSPKASLFIFEHNPINPFTQYIVKTCVFDKDVKLLSHNYLGKIAKDTGFLIKKLRFINFFPNRPVFKYLLRFERLLSRIPFGAQYYIHAVKG